MGLWFGLSPVTIIYLYSFIVQLFKKRKQIYSKIKIKLIDSYEYISSLLIYLIIILKYKILLTLHSHRGRLSGQYIFKNLYKISVSHL